MRPPMRNCGDDDDAQAADLQLRARDAGVPGRPRGAQFVGALYVDRPPLP